MTSAEPSNVQQMRIQHASLTYIRITVFTLVFLFFGILESTRSSLAYDPPKGIPDPADYFESFGEIDQNPPSATARCPEWPAGVSTGCYYIDNSVSCSNTTYGWPNQPRCNLPSMTGLPAGAYVEIHGPGTYTDNFRFASTGSASNPLWVVGIDQPVINATMDIGFSSISDISYVVFTGLRMGTNRTVSVRPRYANNVFHHIIIRNMTFAGDGSLKPGSAIGIGAGLNSQGSSTSNVVVYNNIISGFGDKDPDSTDESCGIYGQAVTNLWALDNTIHDIAEDGIAGCHQCTAEDRLSNYFIGGNTVYDTGANSIDLKGVNGVIISSNDLTGPYPRYIDGNGGAPIVLHYGASSTPTSNAWVLFNKIHEAQGGVTCTSCEDAFIVGNVIYDQHHTLGFTEPCAGTAACMRGTTGKYWVVDNSIYNVDEGVRINQSLDSNDEVKIHGNIISNRADATRYDIRIDGGSAYADLDYNSFYNPAGAATIYWNSASRNLAYMQGTAAECAHCFEGNPGLSNPPTSFLLSENSPCNDSSIEHAVYGLFSSRYPGHSIRKDYEGISRPQGVGWDIGAYEYISAAPDTTPPAQPTGLIVS